MAMQQVARGVVPKFAAASLPEAVREFARRRDLAAEWEPGRAPPTYSDALAARVRALRSFDAVP
jgi:hypothetical protein